MRSTGAARCRDSARDNLGSGSSASRPEPTAPIARAGCSPEIAAETGCMPPCTEPAWHRSQPRRTETTDSTWQRFASPRPCTAHHPTTSQQPRRSTPAVSGCGEKQNYYSPTFAPWSRSVALLGRPRSTHSPTPAARSLVPAQPSDTARPFRLPIQQRSGSSAATTRVSRTPSPDD